MVPYPEQARAVERLKDFQLRRYIVDLGALLDWTRARSNGRVVGLGICFGGPFLLRFAAEARLSGGVTWHGSRMESFLDRAGRHHVPPRMHFGAADPIAPPEAIDKIRAAFAGHPDVSIAVHPGAVHGYAPGGDAHDAAARQAGLDATHELLEYLA